MESLKAFQIERKKHLKAIRQEPFGVLAHLKENSTSTKTNTRRATHLNLSMIK